MNKVNIKKTCMAALFAAVIAALSQVAIPTPIGVSVTMQTFAIAVTAFLLGIKVGVAATLCYIFIGAAGAPVFTGFSGGIAVVLGPTGGFIIAFPIFCLILGFVFYVNKAWVKISLCALSLIILYLFGTVQFVLVTHNAVKTALSAFSLYFIKDALILAGAYFLCVRIRPKILRFIQSK